MSDSVAPSLHMPEPSDLTPRPRSRLRRPLLILAATCIVAAAYFAWQHRRAGAGDASPLDPAATSAGSVLVPAESEMAQAPAAAGQTTAAASGAIAEEKAAPGALARIAIAAASGDGQVVSTVTDALKELTVGVSRAHERLDAVEANDRAQNEQLASLRSDVDQLKSAPSLAGGAAPSAVASTASPPPDAEHGDRNINITDRPAVAAPARQGRAHRAHTRTQTAPTRQAAARRPQVQGASPDVLSVDTWGGKPSVALITVGDGRSELRFMEEGDAHGGLILRQADAVQQRARFAAPGSGADLNLTPKESQR